MNTRIRFENLKAEKNLSLLAHSLFSAWMLSLVFEGQILFALAKKHNKDPLPLVFFGVFCIFLGLVISGFIVNSKNKARKLFIFSYSLSIILSITFYFPTNNFWWIAISLGAFLAGMCVGSWGYYVKGSGQDGNHIVFLANMMILSNLLTIIISLIIVYINIYLSLSLAILMLFLALLLALSLPKEAEEALEDLVKSYDYEKSLGIIKPLFLLWIFIFIITINSGIMYEVINPAFSKFKGLTSWYWILPYLVILFIMKKLPASINKAYILYIAIGLMGLSFIGFLVLDISILSFIIINTLLMGACGIFDIFWWSILAKMLEAVDNPAKILGVGISANVLGIFLGSILSGFLTSGDLTNPNPIYLALTIVFLSLILLLPLNKYLSELLKEHIFLFSYYSEEIEGDKDEDMIFDILSERENQVTSLLLQGKTYRKIGEELFISENTVKYYVKNIYSKFNINSRGQLIDLALDRKKKL